MNNTKLFILAAFFTALTAACSIISIPLPFSPVPVNPALLAVYLSGGLLGSKYGFLSQLIYLILGAFGVPVFHNLTGGLGIIMGPTGGFIFGYLAAAFLTGLIYHRSSFNSGSGNPHRIDRESDLQADRETDRESDLQADRETDRESDLQADRESDRGNGLKNGSGPDLKNKNTRSLLVAITAGLLACYALGLLWFMYLTGSGLVAALMLCVIPFIPGDILKIMAAIVLIKKLEPFVKNPY